MTIDLAHVVLRRIEMDLQAPFTTSFGTQTSREVLLVEAHAADGTVGWAECVASRLPLYSEETVDTCQAMLTGVILPQVFDAGLEHPRDLVDLFAPIRRNTMAKAAIECALWDLYARQQGQPLARALGGTRDSIEVGVSIGLQETDDALLARVQDAVDRGFRRIKMKIRPGRDVDMVTRVRREFPDVPMMVDANSAYTLDDADHLARLDDLDLMMIEQPLGHDDIVDHAELATKLRTPICLDESIHSVSDARKALRIGAGRIINIKTGRVGGLSASIAIHDLCVEEGIPVWCGGMLETGIGRAMNIAMTSLPGFTLPGDTAPSANYWKRDIIDPEVTMDRGEIAVPTGPGLGYEVDHDQLESVTRSVVEVRPGDVPNRLVD